MDIFTVIKFFILSLLFNGSFEDCSCRKEFRDKHYIPDFAKGVKRFDLKVTYDKMIKCGDTVTLIQAASAPNLTLDITDKCENVTVIEFSPDSTVFSPFLRWMAQNVPSTALKKGFKNGGEPGDTLEGQNEGNVVCPYQLPADPLAGSGVRNDTVVFFIYCQCHYISNMQLCLETDRQKFNLTKYTMDNGLGCPAAGFYHYFSVTGLPIPSIVKVDKVDVPVDTPKKLSPVNAPPQPDLPVTAPSLGIV